MRVLDRIIMVSISLSGFILLVSASAFTHMILSETNEGDVIANGEALYFVQFMKHMFIWGVNYITISSWLGIAAILTPLIFYIAKRKTNEEKRQ